MKNILLIILAFFCFSLTNAQTLSTGDYDMGLTLAFDKNSNKVTGFVESYTGFDEKTQKPSFSCIFYLEGVMNGNVAEITTFATNFRNEQIKGTLEIIDDKNVKIILEDNHGGCWNVLPLKDDGMSFGLLKSNNLVAAKIVKAEKSYFHTEKSLTTQRKAYVIKNDVIWVEKIEGEWAYCSFKGEKATTKGWVLTKDLE